MVQPIVEQLLVVLGQVGLKGSQSPLQESQGTWLHGRVGSGSGSAAGSFLKKEKCKLLSTP